MTGRSISGGLGRAFVTKRSNVKSVLGVLVRCGVLSWLGGTSRCFSVGSGGSLGGPEPVSKHVLYVHTGSRDRRSSSGTSLNLSTISSSRVLDLQRRVLYIRSAFLRGSKRTLFVPLTTSQMSKGVDSVIPLVLIDVVIVSTGAGVVRAIIFSVVLVR